MLGLLPPNARIRGLPIAMFIMPDAAFFAEVSLIAPIACTTTPVVLKEKLLAPLALALTLLDLLDTLCGDPLFLVAAADDRLLPILSMLPSGATSDSIFGSGGSEHSVALVRAHPVPVTTMP